MKINPNGFREYDARWIFEKDIDIEGITNLGKGLGTQIIQNTKINNPRVTVGHDYRSYSEKIKKALTEGLVKTIKYFEKIILFNGSFNPCPNLKDYVSAISKEFGYNNAFISFPKSLIKILIF